MKILVLAALASLQPAAATPPAGEQPRIFATSGYIAHGGDENGGWFQFAESSQRFRLPANSRERDTYLRLLTAALERGVSLRVRYDASAGRANAEGAYVEYPLCALTAANGASFGDEAVNCPARPATPGPAGERALAVGLALVDAQPAEARRRLGEALGDPLLASSLRAVALRARGEAAEGIAYDRAWVSEAHDRATLEALADYREWVAVAADEPEAQHATARVLADLGGYDEAMVIYQAIGRRWPQEAFDVAIRTGALLRRQGRYREALAALDAYVALAGPTDGMRMNYHRGWTLHLLDRPAETVTEIDRGLQSQPDYPYAYFMRSCAQAKLGHLREALADQERGLELLSGRTADAIGALAEDLRQSRALVETLRRLVASRQQRATDAPCNGFWQRDIRSRPRSALLGPRPR